MSIKDRDELELLHAILAIIKMFRIAPELIPEIDKHYFVTDEEAVKSICTTIVDTLNARGYGKIETKK